MDNDFVIRARRNIAVYLTNKKEQCINSLSLKKNDGSPFGPYSQGCVSGKDCYDLFVSGKSIVPEVEYRICLDTARPPNDDTWNAEHYPDSNSINWIPGTLKGATMQPGEPGTDNTVEFGSVWYSMDTSELDHTIECVDTEGLGVIFFGRFWELDQAIIDGDFANATPITDINGAQFPDGWFTFPNYVYLYDNRPKMLQVMMTSSLQSRVDFLLNLS